MTPKRVAYRAVFKREANGIFVTFPELKGCMTQGETIEDAIFMARDALGLFLIKRIERGFDLPPANTAFVFEKSSDDSTFTQFIDVDLREYVHSSKPVKKTLSIPEWLNAIAEQHEINYSMVLKKALIRHLMNEVDEESLKESEKYLLDLGLAYFT